MQSRWFHPQPYRMSECLSLRPADLRLNQDPPILSLRPDVPGNKVNRGCEVPAPADMVESLADLKSFHRKDRNLLLFNIRRQWVRKSMKEAAVAAGIDSARAHPRTLSHTYGRNTGRSTACLGLQRQINGLAGHGAAVDRLGRPPR